MAVKLLRDDSNYAEELQQEINNMHRLKHPNLIQLHGVMLTRPIAMVRCTAIASTWPCSVHYNKRLAAQYSHTGWRG